jgi:hypothetical protein
MLSRIGLWGGVRPGEDSFWQISGKGACVVVVLIRLMLVVLIPADGFQGSG